MPTDLEELIVEARAAQSRGKRPVFTVEFKRKVVNLLKSHKEPELITTLGISSSALRKWQQLYGPRTKKVNRSKKKKTTVEFAPVIPSSLEKRAQPVDSQFHMEFSDNQGRRLSLQMPWNSEMAGSLFQFVGQTLMNGGLPCSK